MLFRNVRSQRYLVFERFIIDIKKIPNLETSGYLITKYNELYMMRSIKITKGATLIDNKKVDGKKKKRVRPSKNKSIKNGSDDSNSDDEKSIDHSSNSNSNSSSKHRERKESICLHFAAVDGCRKGDKCKYLHVDPRNDNDKEYLKRYLSKYNLKPKVGLDLD